MEAFLLEDSKQKIAYLTARLGRRDRDPRRGMKASGQPPTATALTPASLSAACAAARRASGTRYGEHET